MPETNNKNRWDYLRVDPKAVIESCKQAIHLDPDNPLAHYVLGSLYIFVHNKKAALEECRILNGLDKEGAKDLLDLINND
jgi:hypothetical protein